MSDVTALDPPPERSLASVACGGSRLDTLVALRALLAATIIEAEPQHRAALARQLRDTMADIEAVNRKETPARDDLAERRDRLSASDVLARAAGDGVNERPGRR